MHVFLWVSQNSPDSIEYAIKLFQAAREAGSTIMRKGIAFAAALAIKQGQPQVALEMLTNTIQQNYVTVRNLKVSLQYFQCSTSKMSPSVVTAFLFKLHHKVTHGEGAM